MFSQESDIIKTMRFIEELKADILSEAGKLYKAMAVRSEEGMKEALASIVVLCYVLGRRLGFNFVDLDETIKIKVRDSGNAHAALEERFGDFSKLERYLKQKEWRNGE